MARRFKSWLDRESLSEYSRLVPACLGRLETLKMSPRTECTLWILPGQVINLSKDTHSLTLTPEGNIYLESMYVFELWGEALMDCKAGSFFCCEATPVTVNLLCGPFVLYENRKSNHCHCIQKCSKATKAKNTNFKLSYIPAAASQRNPRRLGSNVIRQKNWTESIIGNACVCSVHFISGKINR